MKIGFYSCMNGMAWGGSEELWSRAARRLLSQGQAVTVCYKWWPKTPYMLQLLGEEGADVEFRDLPPKWWHRKVHEARQFFSARPRPTAPSVGRGAAWLARTRPDLVLITLGYHPDSIPLADECQRRGIPYAINVQSASYSVFIHADGLADYRRWYEGARRVFFVSPENQRKMETNLAADLPTSEIVANPFNVHPEKEFAWPEPNGVWRLACVGRIHFVSKGQDLLVDVMGRPHWRARPLEIHFYGHDQGNRRQLEGLIQRAGLSPRLKVVGYQADVARIWSENHGLVLPSRYEGAPLVVVEAMLARRLVISTDLGRNRELIGEGESGFIAPAATADLLDEALERAWAARERWRAIGERAGETIRTRYPLDPVGDFARRLLELAASPPEAR